MLQSVPKQHGADASALACFVSPIDDFADSSRPRGDEPSAEHQRLSSLGKQAVAALNRLGVITSLVRRGYDEAQIGKIWGGNILPVFRAVEAESKRSQK